MSNRQQASFFADVDRVWMDDDRPEGDRAILWQLARESPEDAANMIRELFARSAEAITATQKLGLLGIACGELTPNKAIPSGVRAIWRSDLPVMLVTHEEPRRYDRAAETARELGRLIYLDRKIDGQEFMGHMGFVIGSWQLATRHIETARRELEI